MVNYVINKLSMDGIESMPLYGKSKDGVRFFDLNKIEAMPKRLDVGNFNLATAHIASWLGLHSYTPADFENLGKRGCVARIRDIVPGIDHIADRHVRRAVRYLDNLQRYGYMSWYQWMNVHWGCKNNTWNLEILSPNGIAFITPWTPPLEALRKLARQHPGVPMKLVFTDHDECTGEWTVDKDGVESCSDHGSDQQWIADVFGRYL